jgi:LacI family transcriptional regulator
MSKPVRLKDIARKLGVSEVTVSKVLRNKSDVGAETRRRVLACVRRMNYQPDWAARSLATGRSSTVGLVIPDLSHSFFADVAGGIATLLRTHGYSLLISNSEEAPELEEREIQNLLARRVEGLIVASCQPCRRPGVLTSLTVPLVLIDRDLPGVGAGYVGLDSRAIGRMGAMHLIERGSARLAHLRGPNIATGIGRAAGFRAALRAAGLPCDKGRIVQAGVTDETGYRAMKGLLALDPRPDGVFAYNDAVAAGALRAILEAGLRVPEDIALIGSGKSRYMDLLAVPLSTIDQKSALMGVRAAGMLLDILQKRRPAPPRRLLLEPEIIVRRSSAPARAAAVREN